jgi:hypothetical protein
MTFSYLFASQEQLVQHIANASRASVSAALRRYREQGQTDLVSRIQSAYLQARISRLTNSLNNKGN